MTNNTKIHKRFWARVSVSRKIEKRKVSLFVKNSVLRSATKPSWNTDTTTVYSLQSISLQDKGIAIAHFYNSTLGQSLVLIRVFCWNRLKAAKSWILYNNCFRSTAFNFSTGIHRTDKIVSETPKPFIIRDNLFYFNASADLLTLYAVKVKRQKKKKEIKTYSTDDFTANHKTSLHLINPDWFVGRRLRGWITLNSNATKRVPVMQLKNELDKF